jgi:hypothetical protein
MRIALFCLLLALLWASTADAEQRRFVQPRVNGLIVDRCSPWGSNCGQGGADAFCRQQGYDRAAAWDLVRPGRTWVLGTERACVGRDCEGFRYVDCARHNTNYPGSPHGSERFDFPRVNGIPVDRCAVWGERCGQGGADQFCATKGFSRAAYFETYRPGRTWVIGSRRTCEGGECEALRTVTCSGDSDGTLPPPGFFPPINRPTRFERPMMRGASVDACASWAERCQRGGADLFCQQKGFTGAVNWQHMPSNRTYVIGSNRFCNESCTALRYVDCGRR